jgi:ABC-type Fe3+/spermidine/putrescine transport system ATPase subunit
MAPADIASGAEAAVSVRPEAIDIALRNAADSTKPAANINALDGAIVATTFMGASLRYEVRVADRIIFAIAPPRYAFAVGDKVALRFSCDSTVAVPREPRP